MVYSNKEQELIDKFQYFYDQIYVYVSLFSFTYFFSLFIFGYAVRYLITESKFIKKI